MNDADDVDDRIERADFVQVDLVERHVVDRGLRLAEPAEEVNRAILALPRERRALDEAGNVLQAVMRSVVRCMTAVALVIVAMIS